MFDLDQFVADCQEARRETEPRRAIRDVLTRACAHADDMAATLRPEEGGIKLLHRSPELTVLHVVWAPRMDIYPHDHRMWAAIGIYQGQEDNAFYRRSAPGQGTLVESGGKELATGEVLVLGDDVIHAVANRRDDLTGAVHVYGGDFVEQPRSQWGPGPLEERRYEIDDAHRQFEMANRAWRSTAS